MAQNAVDNPINNRGRPISSATSEFQGKAIEGDGESEATAGKGFSSRPRFCRKELFR